LDFLEADQIDVAVPIALTLAVVEKKNQMFARLTMKIMVIACVPKVQRCDLDDAEFLAQTRPQIRDGDS